MGKGASLIAQPESYGRKRSAANLGDYQLRAPHGRENGLRWLAVALARLGRMPIRVGQHGLATLVEAAGRTMRMAHSPGGAKDGVQAEEAERQDECKGDGDEDRVPCGVEIPLVHD